MSSADVVSWLREILIDEAGFNSDEAHRAADASSSFGGSFNRIRAITAAIGARTTPRLPGGKRWWNGDGRWHKERLIAGDVDSAVYRIAEMLAEPAPDAWDPSWPEYKRFSMPLPEGSVVGDEFVVGNGEGQRGRFRVEERDGRLGAVLIDSWWSLDDLWDVANREADALVNA